MPAYVISILNREKSLKRIAGIYDSILEILRRSQYEKLPTETIAEQMAIEMIEKGTSK